MVSCHNLRCLITLLHAAANHEERRAKVKLASDKLRRLSCVQGADYWLL